MFIKKTPAEFNALTEADQIKYLQEKEANDKEVVKAQIEEATKNFVTKEKYEELEKANKLQGEVITELKEKSSGGSNVKKGILSTLFAVKAKEFDEKDRNRVVSTTVKAPALMSTANISTVTTDGFSPLFNNYIDGDVGKVAKPDNFVLSLADVRTQKGTEAIYYSDFTHKEGDAEFIGEGALKPLIDGEWTSSKKNIKEVAVRWKFTKRLLNHAPAVESDFKEHANQLIEQKIDDIALMGDESVNDLEFDGMATLASPFIVPAELANYYVDANIYDAIIAVATYVRLNNFKGNLTCVLNTVWKAKMSGIKDKNGVYLIPPFVTQDGNKVGEITVQFQNKMPASSILLGETKKYKVIIAEDVEYDEGYENDDFSKNLVSRKLEAFMGSYIKNSDAGSIIFDDIATVLTAIEV